MESYIWLWIMQIQWNHTYVLSCDSTYCLKYLTLISLNIMSSRLIHVKTCQNFLPLKKNEWYLYAYTAFCVSFIRSWIFWVVFGYCEWCHYEYLFTCFSFFNSLATSLVVELLDTRLNISGWKQASLALFLTWRERCPSSSWSSF